MLDGKYEITSEQELGAQVTLFSATAPDGAALTISWYDLETPADERAFEQYRALLRQLRRGGHAAIYDLVSRPGAHYVAWRQPAAGALPVVASVVPNTVRAELNAIEEVLAAQGRDLSEAQLCATPGAPPQIYALDFVAVAGSPTTAPSSPTTPNNPLSRPLSNRWAAAWAAFRPWAPACILGLLGVFFLLLSWTRLLQNELVSVPDVRGQEINVALTRLYEAGFRTVPVALTSARRAGEVLEVRPPVGTALRPGRTLSVRYALPAGRAPEAAPNVIGSTLARAETMLAGAGFRVAEVARSPSRAPRGSIIAQIPAVGAPTTPGGRFSLLVSDGPLGELTFLPDLTGLPLEDALGLAEAAGFTRSSVKLERTPGNGTPAGTVLAQNIAPYISVPLAQAQLRLTLAAANTPLASDGTPDLTGLSLERAQQRARILGQSVVVGAQVDAPELPRGVVLQRPQPGAPPQGSINVTLNRAPVVISKPQVVVSVAPAPAPEVSVRRARYVWQLGQDAGGRSATITVTRADGVQETVLRAQQVTANQRLEGTYLTTAPGPLVFSLTLDGQAYGAPITVP